MARMQTSWVSVSNPSNATIKSCLVELGDGTLMQALLYFHQKHHYVPLRVAICPIKCPNVFLCDIVYYELYCVAISIEVLQSFNYF